LHPSRPGPTFGAGLCGPSGHFPRRDYGYDAGNFYSERLTAYGALDASEIEVRWRRAR
jgi:hypothetical protein